jgi:hypothetical protein
MRTRYYLPAIMFVIVVSVWSCALFRDVKPDDFTKKCTHCHGEKLQGINNAKATCGECHDISVPLIPENVTNPEIKETLLSDPHIHKAKNIFTGSPSCFYCHRNGSF